MKKHYKNYTESKEAKRNKHIINKDCSRKTMDLLKQFWKEVKAHRDKGKVVYVTYRTVVVRKERNFEK